MKLYNIILSCLITCTLWASDPEYYVLKKHGLIGHVNENIHFAIIPSTFSGLGNRNQINVQVKATEDILFSHEKTTYIIKEGENFLLQLRLGRAISSFAAREQITVPAPCLCFADNSSSQPFEAMLKAFISTCAINRHLKNDLDISSVEYTDLITTYDMTKRKEK